MNYETAAQSANAGKPTRRASWPEGHALVGENGKLFLSTPTGKTAYKVNSIADRKQEDFKPNNDTAANDWEFVPENQAKDILDRKHAEAGSGKTQFVNTAKPVAAEKVS